MNYRVFVTYNVIGGLLWGVGVTALGYLLGGIPFVKANIEPILLLIVFISVLPIIFELGLATRRRRSSDRNGSEEVVEPFETPVIEEADEVQVDLDPR
jgi:membrane-associated protein